MKLTVLLNFITRNHTPTVFPFSMMLYFPNVAIRSLGCGVDMTPLKKGFIAEGELYRGHTGQTVGFEKSASGN